MSAWRWVLGRALQYAIGTAVIALLIATISGADAERFASTAYVAAIVAALLVGVQWFLPSPSEPVSAPRRPIFPEVFFFSLGVAVLLVCASALIVQPGDEVRLVLVCGAVIFIAVLVRRGAIIAVRQRLDRGDRLSVAMRYASAAAAVAMAASATLASDAGDIFARTAYAAALIATVALAASLIAPTRAGEWLVATCHRVQSAVTTPAGAEVFARTAQYAVATAIAALVLAGLAAPPVGERFATAAYVATLFAALAVVMIWRLRNVAPHPAPAQPLQPARFAGIVAICVLVAAALSLNVATEALGACVCLYVIGAQIAKTASVTTRRP